MTVIHKPAIVIAELGELGRLPDGGIINAGGVGGPHFTIDGKAVILADGTASDGSGQVIPVGNYSHVKGFEFVQSTDSLLWVVEHNAGSKRLSVTVWDEADEETFANLVKIIDFNTVHITFNTPMKGRAILMIF